MISNVLRWPLHWYRQKQVLKRAWVPNLGLETNQRPIGRCLISYVSKFARYYTTLPNAQAREWASPEWDHSSRLVAGAFSSHTMWWESLEMVRQFIVRGYIVDVVDDRLGACVPDITRYDVIVDEWTNLPRWIEANPAALTLFYATGAHWLTWNQAELQRLSWLRDRTNCEIAPVRLTPALLGSHHANLITSFGNEAINATFGKDTAKIHKLWISAVRTHEPLRNKSWERAKRRFLWFGGPGWVHKGLDLAIEAFLQMEDLELVICGFGPHHDVRNDLDIRECYGDRLDSAPNIVLRGYLDPLGEEFAELANSCVGLVYPTGCEGCSGAAVQCLHMGLLPITTALCGLDAGAEPIIVDGSSDRDLIESIIASCNKMSEWPNNVLEQRRVQAWEFANANHTRSGYRRSWSTAVDSLLGVTSRTHP